MCVERIEISYSRVSSYLRCPFAHYMSYVKKITPKKPARPLFFGSDFHKLLEFRGDKKALNKAIKDIKETYYNLPAKFQTDLGEDYVDDLKTIFKDYNKVYKDSYLPDVTEQDFEMRIGKYKGVPVYFVGVIDGLYKIDGKTIVEEHKTFSRKPDMNTLIMNTQKCLYAKAVEKIQGKLPDAVMWDYIKSTPAKEPVWLEKSQKLSMAKSEYITPYSWERACKRHGIESEAVISQGKAHYEGNIQNFFFRVTLDFVPEMVEKVWQDYLYMAQEICKKGETNKTMNVTRDCSWCNFQPLCHAMMSGSNEEQVNYIVEKDFMTKEKREKKEVIEV